MRILALNRIRIQNLLHLLVVSVASHPLWLLEGRRMFANVRKLHPCWEVHRGSQ